mmetsp:Transcript_23445/g.30446  ORF Transcript_23445/g.30446 Transcript_23445/m.30446 type:complete len:203 (+) Transcript_23445:938-1546(+)
MNYGHQVILVLYLILVLIVLFVLMVKYGVVVILIINHEFVLWLNLSPLWLLMKVYILVNFLVLVLFQIVVVLKSIDGLSPMIKLLLPVIISALLQIQSVHRHPDLLDLNTLALMILIVYLDFIPPPNSYLWPSFFHQLHSFCYFLVRLLRFFGEETRQLLVSMLQLCLVVVQQKKLFDYSILPLSSHPSSTNCFCIGDERSR